MSNNIQGSLTVRRLRSGDSLSLYLSSSVDLYQGVDEGTGTISPDWTVAANQPVITPTASSMRGSAVTLSNFVWKNGGSTITFGTASNGWKTSTSPAGVYMLNEATGALKIVKNLASKTNIANDILTFSCTATVAGVEYAISKDITVRIQTVGASSYAASISATSIVLDQNTPESTLTVKLQLGTNWLTTFYTKWYKDDEFLSTLSSSAKTITVDRDDVQGSQLYICECYSDSARTNKVAQHGIVIYDDADEFKIILAITSTQQEVDTNKPVEVTAKVLRNGAEYSLPSTAKWKTSAYDNSNMSTSLKSTATNKIQITTTETDRNGKECDVLVVSEVEF